MTIPARLHFCWIGTSLPWAYGFALLSAAQHSGMAEITLHHTDPLDDGTVLRALQATPGLRLSRTDPLACLARAGHALGLGDALARLYAGLDAPVMRADVLRAAILFLHGGIYLDLDTVTLAPLSPLTHARQFVGCERVVWPQAVRRSRSPLVLARPLALDLLRKALRRAPGGWRAFRGVEGLYFRTVNNAAMGAEAGSELPARLLRAMAALPPDRLTQRTALGPALLQDLLARHGTDGLTLHEPRVFSPLPPEISEHWFRRARRVRLGEALSPDTRVVHWYASVRTRALVAAITPEYVLAHRDRQLYSALVASCVPNLAALCGADSKAGLGPDPPGGSPLDRLYSSIGFQRPAFGGV